MDIDLDDEQLRQVLADAELPALLPALAQLTGDAELIAEDLRPRGDAESVYAPPQGGMTTSQQTRARDAAWRALRTLRDGGALSAEPPPLEAMLAFVTGEGADDYASLLQSEMGLGRGEADTAWTLEELAPDRKMRVAIIGAGASGLAAAHRLAQAGIPFVVFERNADVGGVWFENTYPGARLDTSNFNYSYSFDQNPDWQHQFSQQAEVLAYFADVTDRFDLRRHIRFRTEVISLEYNDAAGTWSLRSCEDEGEFSDETFTAVISAVGQLNQPNLPDVDGIERFAGPWFHTARWRHDVDLRGLRVGVVGTGASSFQVVPAIAEEVGQLAVFQRNPPWMVPTPQYHDELRPGMRWLLDHVPTYHLWWRIYLVWNNVEGRMPYAQVDPSWDGLQSVSAANDRVRQVLTEAVRTQFDERPDLQDAVVPSYPPYGKRMVRDNGVWANALKQPHVSLVTDRISRVTEEGIVTEDGTLHELDVIIYGTGFQASRFLQPITVRGQDGLDLHEHWKDDPRAHVGVTIPRFPNLFMLYGPNTNLVVHGSVIMFVECAVDYVMGCLRLLLETSSAAIDIRQDAFDSYQQRVDEANAMMAWGAADVDSWYKNTRGRVTQNWPLPVLEYWKLTRGPVPEEYDLFPM